MTTNWILSRGGLWDSASNWSTGSVPSSSSANVDITTAGTYQVLIQQTDPSYTMRSLTIGGSGSNPTLVLQGQLNVQNISLLGGQSSLDVGQTGTLDSSRLTLSGGTTIDQGVVNVSGALSGSSTVAIDGGELFASTLTGSNSFLLTADATLEISNSQSATGAIDFADQSSNTLNLDMAGSSFSAALTGFGGGDTIDIGSLAYNASYTTSYSNGVLAIDEGGRAVFSFTDYSGSSAISLSDDGDGGTELQTAPCFLPGTLILTAAGERAVETLRPGDQVLTLGDGGMVARPLIWVGAGRREKAQPHAGGIHPVRVLAHAFASDMPRRDLLVTPDHGLFVEGRLIPARMLVNGRSIVEESGVSTYAFHHIECQEHAILVAEGLPTESYLDTGNRLGFSRQDPPVPSAARPLRRWDQDSCAPLTTSRAFVEPVWQLLRQRAEALGLPPRGMMQRATSADPVLRLQLDDGRLLAATDVTRAHQLFRVPDRRRAIALLSRSAVPADAIGPFVDDRRRLGVQVGRVVWWDGLLDTPIDVHQFAGGGWYDPEAGARWTDGCASLNLPPAAGEDCFVEIEIASSLVYPEAAAEVRLAA